MSNKPVDALLESDGTAADALMPLERLPIGQAAVVVFIHTTRHTYLQRLSALGFAPGQTIRLRQTRPAIVLQIGETELALDDQAGREIFVRRRPAQATAAHSRGTYQLERG